jgi:uncharacterized membrane-anchored protein
MKKISTVFIITNLLLLLGYINYSIYAKEKILTEGNLVLLRLAPVDPRSLIQGDYMQLSYEISNGFENPVPRKGYCIVMTDSNGVAKRVRFQQNLQPLSGPELAIAYSRRNSWTFKIGAESYFFQEGDAEKFTNAKYGGLRIDGSGNSVLVGLFDEKFRQIR